MKKGEVLLTPTLSKYIDFKDKVVVVIDVFRATSTILSAFNSGQRRVLTTSEVSIALKHKGLEYVIAGERNGKKLDHFDMGNSPVEIEAHLGSEPTFLLTTTNGTQCIELAYRENAAEVLIASFANVSAIISYLNSQSKDVIIFCAGWKGMFNLEDSLCAGYILKGLQSGFYLADDSSQMVLGLCDASDGMPYEYLKRASHFNRLAEYGNHADLVWSCNLDAVSMVPFLESLRKGVATLAVK